MTLPPCENNKNRPLLSTTSVEIKSNQSQENNDAGTSAQLPHLPPICDLRDDINGQIEDSDGLQMDSQTLTEANDKPIKRIKRKQPRQRISIPKIALQCDGAGLYDNTQPSQKSWPNKNSLRHFRPKSTPGKKSTRLRGIRVTNFLEVFEPDPQLQHYTNPRNIARGLPSSTEIQFPADNANDFKSPNTDDHRVTKTHSESDIQLIKAPIFTNLASEVCFVNQDTLDGGFLPRPKSCSSGRLIIDGDNHNKFSAFSGGGSFKEVTTKRSFRFKSVFDPDQRVIETRRKRRSMLTIARRHTERSHYHYSKLAAKLSKSPSSRSRNFNLLSGNITSFLRQQAANNRLDQGDILPHGRRRSPSPPRTHAKALKERTSTGHASCLKKEFEQCIRIESPTVPIARAMDLVELRSTLPNDGRPNSPERPNTEKSKSKTLQEELNSDEMPPRIIINTTNGILHDSAKNTPPQSIKEKQELGEKHGGKITDRNISKNKERKKSIVNGNGKSQQRIDLNTDKNGVKPKKESEVRQQGAMDGLGKLRNIIEDVQNNEIIKSIRRFRMMDRTDDSQEYGTVDSRVDDEVKVNTWQWTNHEDTKSTSRNETPAEDTINLTPQLSPSQIQNESCSIIQFQESVDQVANDVAGGDVVSELLRKYSHSLSESLRKKVEGSSRPSSPSLTLFEESVNCESKVPGETGTGNTPSVIEASDVIGSQRSLSRFRHLGRVPVIPPSKDDIKSAGSAPNRKPNGPNNYKILQDNLILEEEHQRLKLKKAAEEDSELLKRMKTRVVRMRQKLPARKSPGKLCFLSLVNNSKTHKEVKNALERLPNIKITSLKYDPVYIEDCNADGFREMWVFEISPDSDRKRLLLTNKIRVKGEPVFVRLLDDVHMEEYRSYTMLNNIRQEQLQKRIAKPNKKLKKAVKV